MHLAYVTAQPSYTAGAYLVYLALSVLLTRGVARTLSVHGRALLVDAFHGDAARADAVGHFIRVVFDLAALGLAAVALPSGTKPWDLVSALESLSGKIGLVMLAQAVLLALTAIPLVNLGASAAWRRATAQRPSSGHGHSGVTSTPSP